MSKKIACSWSGGKDACLALIKAVELGYQPVVLFNIMNENGKISRSHGLPKSILEAQAKAAKIPLVTLASSWNAYEKNFIAQLKKLKQDYQIDAVVFGDIDLEAHRDWEEKVCAAARLECLLPSWGKTRTEAANEIITANISARITSCRAELASFLCGEKYDQHLLHLLRKQKIDLCGEGGEFHTVVENCPLFTQKIQLPKVPHVQHEAYSFLQWDS